VRNTNKCNKPYSPFIITIHTHAVRPPLFTLLKD